MRKANLPCWLLVAAWFATGPLVSPFASAEGKVAAATYFETPPGEKPRVVVTTDPELDDFNSLIRYLLHGTDFHTEGLVYASSGVHWKGDGKGTPFSRPGREYDRFGLHLCPCTSYRWAPASRHIDDAVDAYAKAFPNLRVHDPRYPSPRDLRSRIVDGNVDFDGEMEHDTPGSNLIKRLLLDARDRPVYLLAWGGQSTIARALQSIEEHYKQTPEWPEIRRRVIAKAVIYPSGDQDDTYASYIRPNWPEIRYRELQGGVTLGYDYQSSVSESDAAYFSAPWMRTNVSSRGPLGVGYRVWGDGKQMVADDRFDYFGLADLTGPELKRRGYIVWTPPHAQGEFIGEGDTPTFLNLIDNGLRAYHGDSLGGWGGHVPAHRADREQSSVNAYLQELEREVTDPDFVPTPRPRRGANPYVGPLMNDLAARLAWATTARYSDANHPPRILLPGPRLRRVRPGTQLKLRATTSDPDGNGVTLHWWALDSEGTCAGAPIQFKQSGDAAIVRVPLDACRGNRMQVVAEATDNGAPPLTRYEKVVIAVR